MRIAHVITRLVAGGAQRNTLLCAEAQAADGHQVTVLSGVETGSEGSLLEKARNSNYALVEVPAMVREISPKQDLAALLELVKWLRSQRPQVLHTHTSKAGILGRLAALVVPVPVVVHTPHGHVFHSYFSKLKALVFKVLEKEFARFTDATVMLSSGELKDHLKENVGNPAGMYIIPSGVPLAEFESRVWTESGPTKVVGYIGRLADIKGPLDLVDAMVKVRQARSDAKLLMVGDGPLRSQVEHRIREHNLEEVVEITGWQDNAARYFSHIDMLVVPSHNEGMGRVVVEAMSCGLPVVATAVGGLVDLVADGVTGFLTPPLRPDALAERILAVLDLPDQGRQMGRSGQLRAKDFSAEVMVNRLDRLYRKLLRSKGVECVG